MFIKVKKPRTSKRKRSIYVVLVENKREGHRVRQRFLGYLMAVNLDKLQDRDYMAHVIRSLGNKLMQRGLPKEDALQLVRDMLRKIKERVE